MNVTKLFDNTNSFEDYLSFSRRILSSPQYTIINLQFNASTLCSLKKLIPYEIEYFNKYNEFGAVSAVFSQMLQVPSIMHVFSTEDVTSVFCTLLDAVTKNCSSQTRKWMFLDKILTNIQISCRNNQVMSSALVMKISEHLLIMATDNSFTYFQKIHILSCFNYCCFICSKEVRLQKFEKLKTYFIKLAHDIVECEDFFGQMTIMKTLMKWFIYRKDPIKKAVIAKDWFPCHLFGKTAVQFFITCTFENFLKDVREFLNIQNGITKLIVSVRCRKLRVGNKLLVSGEENFNSWIDVNVMAKKLTVLFDLESVMQSNEIDQHLDSLMIQRENIDIAKLDKSSEYILSLRLRKRPDFLFTTPEKILPDAGTDVTVVIAPTDDMSRFENALRDVLCEKLILQSVPHLQVQPQSAASRAKLKNYGVMREPRALKSPSSVSTTSLRRLSDKVATVSNTFLKGKFEGVAVSPRLSVIDEMTDRSTSTRNTDIECNNRIHLKTTAIVHSPAPYSSDKQNINGDERVLRIYELNDLDAIEEDASKTRYDDLDEDIVNQLLKEAFVDITDDDKNENNNAVIEQKTNENTNDDQQKASDINKTDSKNKINGFHAISETVSDSIINDTPMCYVSTRTKTRRGDVEKNQDLLANGVNVDAVEEFFSQHIRERESGEVVISPSVARRINKSSSSSESSESFVGIRELLQINDLADGNTVEVLKEQTVPENIAVVEDKMDQNMDTPNKNGTDLLVEDDKDDERNSSGRKVLTRNTKIDKSKYNTTLIFNSNDMNKTGPTPAKKRDITAKDKKRSKKAAMIPPLQVVEKISIEDKTVTADESLDTKEKSISSKIECQKEESSKILRKRRTLFQSNLDEIEERQHDDNDSQNKNINKSSALPKSPIKIRSSVYEEIEKEKRKREIRIRTIRPRRQKTNKTIAIDSSPRTKKINDMFETVKNSEDLNTVPMNTAKLSSSSANDIAVYNFTSDSEENFVTNTSAKHVLPKSNKIPVAKKTHSRSKRRLFTDETKKTQARKNRLPKNDKTKAKRKPNNRRSKNSLIDEQMRDAASSNLVPANTSIVVAHNIDSEIVEEVLPMKVNIAPVMELIPNGVEKSKRHDESDIKKRKKTDGAQDIAGVTQKEEDNEKYDKVRVEERREKEASPLPGLVIEAVPSHENVKDSAISTNVFTKIKQFYQNPNDMRENITDTTVNITDIENLDNEIPPEPVIDLEISKKTVSESAQIEKAEDVVVICSDGGDKSEKTIDTLKTRSPINGHGDSKESPPDPKVLKKLETPRDKETEDLNFEMKKYYSEFYNKLNALYEKDSSVASKNSSQQSQYRLLNPKVIIEKLPVNEGAINEIKKRKMQIKENATLPVKENKQSELETQESNLSCWKKTACNGDKESKSLSIKKTTPTRLDADLAADGALQLTNLENWVRNTSTTLKTSSPKTPNNDLMFNIRHLEVRISPIKNIDFRNLDSAETLVSDPSSENENRFRKNVANTRNVSYRELMNVSKNQKHFKLPVTGDGFISKKSDYLRSTNEKLEIFEEDGEDTHRKDTKFIKNLFDQLKADKTGTTSENRQRTLCNNSEEEEEKEEEEVEEETCPEVMFENALNSIFGKLEERNITDATLTKGRTDIPNKRNQTAVVDSTSKKGRYNYSISQRELRDLTNSIELKDEMQKPKTVHSRKYYLRSVDTQSCHSMFKGTADRNTVVQLEESRKRTSINQLNLVRSKKQKLAREAPRSQSEMESAVLGTSSSVVHWIEDAMRSSDRDSIVQHSNENISNILERLDTTLKEINRETSLNYLKASADVLNGLTEMKKQVLEIVEETLERWDTRSSDLLADFKKRVEDIMTKDAEKKHLMMVVMKEDLLATRAFLSSAKIGKK